MCIQYPGSIYKTLGTEVALWKVGAPQKAAFHYVPFKTCTALNQAKIAYVKSEIKIKKMKIK